MRCETAYFWQQCGICEIRLGSGISSFSFKCFRNSGRLAWGSGWCYLCMQSWNVCVCVVGVYLCITSPVCPLSLGLRGRHLAPSSSLQQPHPRNFPKEGLDVQHKPHHQLQSPSDVQLHHHSWQLRYCAGQSAQETRIRFGSLMLPNHVFIYLFLQNHTILILEVKEDMLQK